MQENKRKESKATQIVLITISVLFITLMLVIPLISVINNSLSEGVSFYFKSLQT
ncbi:sulfate ABC transporter permease, partial [Lachnotalea glycerini]